MALYIRKNPLVFASGVAVPLTGSTAETTLATIVIPGGSMGPNGFIEIEEQWSSNNDASAKTTFTRFGGIAGTLYGNGTMTSLATGRFYYSLQNRNSLSSQVSTNVFNNGWASQTGALVTSSVDTSANVDLVLRGQLGDATDTITLETYKIKVWYRS